MVKDLIGSNRPVPASGAWPQGRRSPHRTRIHEAGHAVVGIVIGFRLDAINLSPSDKAFSGACLFTYRRPAFLPIPVPDSWQPHLLAMATTKVAGEQAVTIADATFLAEGCWGDYAEAYDYAEALTAPGTSVDAARAIVARQEQEARRILLDRRHWGTVIALAETLVAKPLMLGDHCKSFFEAKGYVMPPGDPLPWQ